MTSQKISQLTAITTVASGDYFPIVRASGVTNQRVEVGVLDARYTLFASGVAAQSTANTALASGVAAQSTASTALASGNAAQSTASTALASGVAAQSTASTALALGNAALPKSGGTMTGDILFNTGQTYPQIPQNSKTTAYTLVAADAGKHISITTGGITVPQNVFNVGDAVSIYNNSGSSQTITQDTGVTLRLAGSASTGNRTISQYGLCTILCVASNVFVISGAILS
jgi:hypothetical protein